MPVTISAPTETKIRRFRISIDGVFNAIKYLIRLRTICVTLRVQSRVSCGLISLIPLELKNEELTEDFTAMIYAMWATYVNITKDSVDVVGFTHIINRLVFQKFVEDKGIKLD